MLPYCLVKHNSSVAACQIVDQTHDTLTGYCQSHPNINGEDCVTLVNWTLQTRCIVYTIASCIVVGLGLVFELDLVFCQLVVISSIRDTHFYWTAGICCKLVMCRWVNLHMPNWCRDLCRNVWLSLTLSSAHGRSTLCRRHLLARQMLRGCHGDSAALSTTLMLFRAKYSREFVTAIMVHIRFRVPYLYHTSGTMQRPTWLLLGLGLGSWWGFVLGLVFTVGHCMVQDVCYK